MGSVFRRVLQWPARAPPTHRKEKRAMVTTAAIRLTRKEFQASEEMRKELEKLLEAGAPDARSAEPGRRLPALVGDMEEIAVSFLDCLPRLRRLWQRLESNQATELGDYRQAVAMMLDLYRE